jgi:hypothetical protein
MQTSCLNDNITKFILKLKEEEKGVEGGGDES